MAAQCDFARRADRGASGSAQSRVAQLLPRRRTCRSGACERAGRRRTAGRVMRRRGGLERATPASASAAESSLLSEQQLGRLLRGEGTSGAQEPEWMRELRRVPGRLPPAPNSSTSDFRKVCSWLFALTFTDSSPLESLRVFLALALSACSKLFGLCVPLLFRRGIEQIELSQGSGGGTGLMDVAVIFMLSGVCRGLAAVCAELRSVTFQPVAQSAGRKVAIATYRHIMGLDIGFHLERNVGKLSRIVDRGTRSVAMVFRALLFTFIPTIIELVLVCVRYVSSILHCTARFCTIYYSSRREDEYAPIRAGYVKPSTRKEALS